MTSRFTDAVERLMSPALEGGYTSGEGDYGGETKYGISKRSYPAEDIKNLTKERAAEIYWRDFWEPYDIDRFPARVGEKFFHFVVNTQPRNAVHVLQRALRSATGEPLVDDGLLGPKTRAVLNGLTSRGLVEATVAAFRSEQAAHYRMEAANDPNQHRYLAGWLKRAYDA